MHESTPLLLRFYDGPCSDHSNNVFEVDVSSIPVTQDILHEGLSGYWIQYAEEPAFIELVYTCSFIDVRLLEQCSIPVRLVVGSAGHPWDPKALVENVFPKLKQQVMSIYN